MSIARVCIDMVFPQTHMTKIAGALQQYLPSQPEIEDFLISIGSLEGDVQFAMYDPIQDKLMDASLPASLISLEFTIKEKNTFLSYENTMANSFYFMTEAIKSVTSLRMKDFDATYVHKFSVQKVAII